uniref:50S ribosomal protein L19, chloroplastic n=1 Tax=Nitzschia sp. IriIs04 TaxID=1444690 RepID=A0A0S3QPL6_9STRA|nr:ribosomal protein L19 [Nitzschia sp. IriIs04]BAT70259.1 ribosomal protein L19 [Nitzschia sp. IriIs04]
MNYLKKINNLNFMNTKKINVGDIIDIKVIITEKDKKIYQFYTGIVIAKYKNISITVRKIIKGIGIEKIFLLDSPKIESINILKSLPFHKSKLYYLRNLKKKIKF